MNLGFAFGGQSVNCSSFIWHNIALQIYAVSLISEKDDQVASNVPILAPAQPMPDALRMETWLVACELQYLAQCYIWECCHWDSQIVWSFYFVFLC